MTLTFVNAPWNAAEVERINADGVDVVVTARADRAAWLAWLEPLPPTARVDRVVTPATVEMVAAESVATLGVATAASAELARDISAVAAAFLDLFGITAAKFRLEVSAGTVCPKFHSDSVHVRMITTYVGPGTEYMHRDAESDVVQVASGNFCFLKGRTHATHTDSVLHRSPKMDDTGARLILALDF